MSIKNPHRIQALGAILTGILLFSAGAQDTQAGNSSIPVTRIALFSSGVSFVEHAGTVSGQTVIPLLFPRDAVNDVLKSLVIHDSESRNPSITYDSEDTLARTLQSLSVDLSGNPGLAEILRTLRGNEVILTVPEQISGRIISVESVPATQIPRGNQRTGPVRSRLNLLTRDGLRTIHFSEISSIQFSDAAISQDFIRALDLLASERDGETRTLSVHLSGTGNRNVALGYIVPSPVWKISYRIDLSQKNPVLQGWAIIDNTSDNDWNSIELTLVSGRPVSFIQQLYPPHHVSRPEIPLAIAGTATAEVYDSPYEMDMLDQELAAAPVQSVRRAKMAEFTASGVSSGTVETARASKAGDLYLYTLKNLVSIPRRQSAMVPLAEAKMTVKKVSVLSGERLSSGEIHPMFCVSLKNESGMQLPAGPVTVFDGGSYAGDALMEFFSEGDTRLLAYGEDLGVTASRSEETTRDVASVSVSRGVLTITRTQKKTTVYQVKNSTTVNRAMIIEHPITVGTALVEPKTVLEKTRDAYRFAVDVAAGKNIYVTVREDRPVSETVVLQQQNTEALLYYATSGSVPADVRKALEKAVEFRRNIADREAALSIRVRERTEQVGEQERVRSNIQAVGTTSRQGQDYLKRLSDIDGEIDRLTAEIAKGRDEVLQLQKQYNGYLESLSFK